MKKGSIWNCGRSIWFNTNFSIKIYEYDNSNDISEIASGFITRDEITGGIPLKITASRGTDDVEFTISASILTN